MGQKVNPNGLRIGINKKHSSFWYANKKEFANYLSEDIKIRKYLEEKLDERKVGLSHIDIERIKRQVKVSVYVVQVALAIGGETGAQAKAYEKHLNKIVKVNGETASINFFEVKNPDLDATVVAKDIARQIENRGSSRIVQKKAIQRVMRAGALGCKTMCKGRVNGAEIARYEEYKEGVLSLHTLRQHIDYGYVVAHTIYGCIGVKVWIALPENYAELRDKRPDEGRFNSRRNFQNQNSNSSGGGSKRIFRPREETKSEPKKGE